MKAKEVTLIIQATKDGNLSEVKRFGSDEKYLHVMTSNKSTLLHLAVSYSHEKIVRFLVNKGLNINAKNNLGNTPIHISAMKGNDQILLFLLEKKGNPNASNNQVCINNYFLLNFVNYI